MTNDNIVPSFNKTRPSMLSYRTLSHTVHQTLRHQRSDFNITVIFLVSPPPEYDLEPCEDPGSPQFGGHAGSRFGIGDSLAFTCNAGYRLQGAREVVCLGGGRRMWSAPLPRCVGTWSALSTHVSFLLLFQSFCCCCGFGCSYRGSGAITPWLEWAFD